MHELGRPLGALRSASQALLGGAGEDPQLRQELVQGMDDELVRLQGLLNELAHLHDQVLGSLDLQIQPVNIQAWIESIIPPWQRLAEDKHLNWQVDFEPTTPDRAIFDPDRMAQVLENLISNAIRYTQSGGHIWLQTSAYRMKVGRSPSRMMVLVLTAKKPNASLSPTNVEKLRNVSRKEWDWDFPSPEIWFRHIKVSLSFTSEPGQGSNFKIWLPLDTHSYSHNQ